MFLREQTHIEGHIDLTQQQLGGASDHFDVLVDSLVEEVVQSACLEKLVGHTHDAPERRDELVGD